MIERRGIFNRLADGVRRIFSRKVLVKEVADEVVKQIGYGSLPSWIYTHEYYRRYPFLFTGRHGEGGLFVMSAQTLRKASVEHPIVRRCINIRKGEVKNTDWEVVPLSRKAKSRADSVAELLKKPHPEYDWDRFIAMLVEDILVLDAGVFQVIWDGRRVKRVAGLIPMDGATIGFRLAEDGTLDDEYPYFQKVGSEEVKFTRDELVYIQDNPRTYTPYGLSPLESLLIVLVTGMWADIAVVNSLDLTKDPEGVLQIDADPDVVAKFYDRWLEARSRGERFAVAAGKGISFIKLRQELIQQGLFTLLERHDRLIASMFGIPVQKLGYYDVNRAAAEQLAREGAISGLEPFLHMLERVINEKLIKSILGYDDIEFRFKGLQIIDYTAVSNFISKLYPGVMTLNEAREIAGLPPVSGGWGDVVWRYDQTNQIPVVVAVKGKEMPLPPQVQRAMGGGEQSSSEQGSSEQSSEGGGEQGSEVSSESSSSGEVEGGVQGG